MNPVLVLAAVADLCAQPLAPASVADPAESARYREVGDEERAAGGARSAVIAYRRALELDGKNPDAREGLATLCGAQPGAEEALAAGLERYRAGDLAHADAWFRLAAAGGGATGSAGHFFLGLEAHRRLDEATAAREFDLAASAPELAGPARQMARIARRSGRIALSLAVLPEVDSNVRLVPDTPPPGSIFGPPEADADLALLGTLTASPTRWLRLRESAVYRKQARVSELDFFGDSSEVALVQETDEDRFALAYTFDVDLLAGKAYLLAQRAAVEARHDAGGWLLSAGYSFRWRGYQTPELAPFDGWVHSASVGAELRLAPAWTVGATLGGVRELCEDPTFSDLAGALGLSLRWAGQNVRLAAGLDGRLALYDHAQPDGSVRRDGGLQLALDFEVDLSDHLSLIGGVTGALSQSTLPDFRYTKAVARIGLAAAFGIL